MEEIKTEHVRTFVRKTQFIAAAAGIVLGLAFSYFWSKSIGLGFITGTGISIINFQLMAVDAFQIAGKDTGKFRKYIMGRYVLRYAIIFICLTLIVTRTDLSIYAVFAGLFLAQIVIVFGRLFQMAGTVVKTTGG